MKNTLPSRFRSRLLCLLLAALFCCAFPAVRAPAEETAAADLTSRCTLKVASGKNSLKKLKDRDYKTYWSSPGGAKAWIEVTLPKQETASGVWLQWYDRNHPWALQVQDASGAWTETEHTEGAYLSEYLPLPEGTDHFRIANPEKETSRMRITELHVYGSGTLPAEVQQWESPAAKADLMLLAAHPDDEVLWFGGALPVYAGERGKVCQVCMVVPTMPYRRLELLDCLWTCGVRNYPVWGKFSDKFSATLKKQYTYWNRNRLYKQVTEWIRRFHPDVLLTHAINGEYGHGAHRACADAVQYALRYAADSEKWPDSVREYGTWDVPKCYLHLYGQNQVTMDWSVPLDAFGGKTGVEVAREAFRCHVSQQKTDYRVEDFGSCDCRLFGLYRSLVGEDTGAGDFFENLE